MRIYVSCPMKIPQSYLDSVVSLVQKLGNSVSCWDRSTDYTDLALNYAEAVVFILPSNSFEFFIEELPLGTKKELKKALTQNKEIYIAYTLHNKNILKIFKAKISDHKIIGILGTTSCLNQDTIFQQSSRIITNDKITLDRRIVLLTI